MKHQIVSVTEFKAKCLALLDQIYHEGGRLTITKRGQPLAIVEPAKRRRFKSPEGALIGKVRIVGDLDKIDNSDLWDCVRDSDDLESNHSRRKR